MLNKIRGVLAQKPDHSLTPQAIRKLEDPKWRSNNSKWRWLVYLSVGVYSGPVLLIQGIRSKSRRLKVCGGLILGTLFAGMLISGTRVEGERYYDLVNSIGSVLFFITLVFGFWATVKYGSDVLVWKATKGEKKSNDWVEENLGISREIHRPEDYRDNLATNAAVQSTAPITPKSDSLTRQTLLDAGLSSNTTSSESKFVGILEINLASEQEIEKSELFTQEQLEVLVARRNSMPFKSMEDLRLTLDLKPHEMVKLGKVLRFTNNGDSKSSPGRVLDF